MTTKQFWTRDDGAGAAFADPSSVRHYAPDPAADEALHEVAQFQRECERDRSYRHYTNLLAEADRYIERLSESEIDRDAEAYFAEQQCPADSNFR